MNYPPCQVYCEAEQPAFPPLMPVRRSAQKNAKKTPPFWQPASACIVTLLLGRVTTVFFNKALFPVFPTPQIRNELEKQMNCNLKEFKEFIDNEMLLILGQMDKPSLIFDHLYLVRGSAHAGVWLGEHKSDLGCLEQVRGGNSSYWSFDPDFDGNAHPPNAPHPPSCSLVVCSPARCLRCCHSWAGGGGVV